MILRPLMRDYVATIYESGIPLSTWERKFLASVSDYTLGSQKQIEIVKKIEERIALGLEEPPKCDW